MNAKVGNGTTVHRLGNGAITPCGKRNKGGYKLQTTSAPVTCTKCQVSVDAKANA